MPVHDWTRVISGTFHDFHQGWIVEIRNALNAGVLPEPYYAQVEQVADGPIPDVLTLERPQEETISQQMVRESGGIALAETPPHVRYTTEAENQIYANKASRVVVRHASGDRVVAYVEIVCTGNKSTRTSLERFFEKLEEALGRGCHLLIIDVLPPGRLDPEGIHAGFWGPRYGPTQGVTAEQPLGLSAYRADISPTAYFEPIAVGAALPDMPLFHYVNVPLEATYRAAWNGVPKRWKDVILEDSRE